MSNKCLYRIKHNHFCTNLVNCSLYAFIFQCQFSIIVFYKCNSITICPCLFKSWFYRIAFSIF